jgi:hypothetical protein
VIFYPNFTQDSHCRVDSVSKRYKMFSHSVKDAVRSLIWSSARNRKVFRWFWQPLGRAVSVARLQQEWLSLGPSVNMEDIIQQVAEDRTVRHGVFRGLKYPADRSIGSALIAKLLGSYERELHDWIKEVSTIDYTEIVDVGCAEGYYAVGLAMLLPATRIWAYDTLPEAIRLCRAMAAVNGVENRMQFGTQCDPQVLLTLPLTRRALILSDCEGYEKTLFNPEVCERLMMHDVLVEAHDYRDGEISASLLNRFRTSHDVRVIRSIPDRRRAEVYRYPELERYDLATRVSALAELRPADMEWFFFRSKMQSQ